MSSKRRGKGRRAKKTAKHGSRKPKAGETVFHCAHYPERDVHWVRLREPRETERGEAIMVGACEACYLLGRRDAHRIKADRVTTLESAA